MTPFVDFFLLAFFAVLFLPRLIRWLAWKAEPFSTARKRALFHIINPYLRSTKYTLQSCRGSEPV